MRKELKRKDIRRLRLKPGDFILIRTDYGFTPGALENLQRAFSEVVGFRVGVIEERTLGDIQRLPPATLLRIKAQLDEAITRCHPTQSKLTTKLKSI